MSVYEADTLPLTGATEPEEFGDVVLDISFSSHGDWFGESSEGDGGDNNERGDGAKHAEKSKETKRLIEEQCSAAPTQEQGTLLPTQVEIITARTSTSTRNVDDQQRDGNAPKTIQAASIDVEKIDSARKETTLAAKELGTQSIGSTLSSQPPPDDLDRATTLPRNSTAHTSSRTTLLDSNASTQAGTTPQRPGAREGASARAPAAFGAVQRAGALTDAQERESDDEASQVPTLIVTQTSIESDDGSTGKNRTSTSVVQTESFPSRRESSSIRVAVDSKRRAREEKLHLSDSDDDEDADECGGATNTPKEALYSTPNDVEFHVSAPREVNMSEFANTQALDIKIGVDTDEATKDQGTVGSHNETLTVKESLASHTPSVPKGDTVVRLSGRVRSDEPASRQTTPNVSSRGSGKRGGGTPVTPRSAAKRTPTTTTHAAGTSSRRTSSDTQTTSPGAAKMTVPSSNVPVQRCVVDEAAPPSALDYTSDTASLYPLSLVKEIVTEVPKTEDVDSLLFDGIRFVLTGMVADENDYKGRLLYNTLLEKIEKHGGRLLKAENGAKDLANVKLKSFKNSWHESVAAVDAELPNVVLLAPCAMTTLKWYWALATGTPRLHYHWLIYSTQCGVVLPVRTFALYSGLSLPRGVWVKAFAEPLYDVEAVCGELRIEVVGTSAFKDCWKHLGAKVVERLLGEERVDLVVCDKNHLDSSDVRLGLEMAEKRQVKCVTHEWVVQCMLGGKRLNLDAYEQFSVGSRADGTSNDAVVATSNGDAGAAATSTRRGKAKARDNGGKKSKGVHVVWNTQAGEGEASVRTQEATSLVSSSTKRSNARESGTKATATATTTTTNKTKKKEKNGAKRKEKNGGGGGGGGGAKEWITSRRPVDRARDELAPPSKRARTNAQTPDKLTLSATPTEDESQSTRRRRRRQRVSWSRKLAAIEENAKDTADASESVRTTRRRSQM